MGLPDRIVESDDSARSTLHASDLDRARARKIAREVLAPNPPTRVRCNGRLLVAEMHREIADKLERGEISGARIQWRDTHDGCFDDDGKVISGIEYVVREPNRVRMQAVTVEEVAL